MPWSIRESVELFHLAFLAQLGPRLGKERFVVKGGCNLRFFFNSVRYSEDLDLDVDNVAPVTLRKATDQILGGPALKHTLGAAGIALTRFTVPKQTDLTQRWKIGFEVSRTRAHTKIEFSRRGITEAVTFGQTDPTLTAYYKLAPLLAQHYTRSAAIDQKLRALLGRSETRARDIFDLNLLLTNRTSTALPLEPDERRAAKDRALSVDFDKFRAEVVAYLKPELQGQYAAPDVWKQMQRRVVDALGESV